MPAKKKTAGKKKAANKGLYIVHISMHGLVTGTNMELGRDSDTGGQIKYVVELCRAMVAHKEVDEVELVTRKIIDPRVSEDYAKDREAITDGAEIVRLPCGPRRYIKKENLWPYVDEFADAVVDYLRKKGRVPDIIHGHYADAGYIAARVAALLDIPMAFTGHSLGRIKKERLLHQGQKPDNIEKKFNIARRIEAEEEALDSADFVVASTRQEVEEQYRTYSNYEPKRMKVVPPGVDLSKFHPPRRKKVKERPRIWQAINKFLKNNRKPAILALSRPDPKKNVTTLLKAYAESGELQKKANLVLILGTRDKIKGLNPTARKIFYDIFFTVDDYNLYGKVAVPKWHDAQEVPDIYRYAAACKGVFINPAVTEPFGLTLLEAAASGLPVVATENGGATEILEKCKNGLPVDPLDKKAITDKLLGMLEHPRTWSGYARAGLTNSHKYYSWEGHVKTYIKEVKKVMAKHAKRTVDMTRTLKQRMGTFDRILVSDIDDTLVGDKASLKRFIDLLHRSGEKASFGIATGRSLPLAMQAFKEWNIPVPNFMITSVGSEIYYGTRYARDRGWEKHINFRWDPEVIHETLKDIPGIEPQGKEGQGRYKISYFMDPAKAPTVKELSRMLRRNGVHAKVIFSHGQFLDIIPLRASKGLAVRYLAMKWGIPFHHVLVAGDSGNDLDMLAGQTLGVVVANHTPDLDELKKSRYVYFSPGERAQGIIDAVEYYDFFGEVRIPDTEES